MENNELLNFNPNFLRTQSQYSSDVKEPKKEEAKGTGPMVKADGSGPILNSTIKREVNNELDKDAFLKLLVTQLQYQDPLSPMDNTQFIAQTAQFTALEQMQNLNSTMTSSQAFGLIGKPVYVETINPTTSNLEQLTGIVGSVEIVNGEPYLNIGDRKIPYKDVKMVGAVPDTDNSAVVSQAMSLIGKTIQAVLMDDELSGVEGFVEGKVDFVKFVDGVPVLSVGGKDVNLYEVVSVSDDTLIIGKEVSATIKGEDNIKGPILDIIVKNVNEDGKNVSKIYAKINDKEVEIQDIGSLSSSIALIGKEIQTEEVSGVVDGVIIKDGKPHLIVGDKEIAYEDVK